MRNIYSWVGPGSLTDITEKMRILEDAASQKEQFINNWEGIESTRAVMSKHGKTIADSPDSHLKSIDIKNSPGQQIMMQLHTIWSTKSTYTDHILDPRVKQAEISDLEDELIRTWLPVTSNQASEDQWDWIKVEYISDQVIRANNGIRVAHVSLIPFNKFSALTYIRT